VYLKKRRLKPSDKHVIASCRLNNRPHRIIRNGQFFSGWVIKDNYVVLNVWSMDYLEPGRQAEVRPEDRGA